MDRSRRPSSAVLAGTVHACHFLGQPHPAEWDWPLSCGTAPTPASLGVGANTLRVAPLPLNLIKEPNVARPELELIGLILGQMLMR